ncbi:MAG: site-2 protease family protein [Actinomycetota bacterium]|nr:site-2 protease family protein [Actinomycetota bacterium]MDI6821319.1 site-2 protease family protein [Actinomycetota bacterium]
MIPFGSVRLGRIFGIPIELNFTWFFIFALLIIDLTLRFQLKPFNLPLVVSIINATITTLLLFASVLFHELSHSYIAKKSGIPIKKITLFIFGGVAQMSKEPENPEVEFKMAIAGPLSSFFLSFSFGLIWVGARGLGLEMVGASFLLLWQINLALAVFNLLPGFPLDGGRVLRAGLWYWMKDMQRSMKIASQAGQGIAFSLIFFGFMMVFVLGDISALWLVLIGWFLNHAAQTSYRQLILQRSLSGIKVAEIMSKDVQIIDPSITLDKLVNEYFLKYRYGRFPVVENDQLLGVITLHDIKEIPQGDWSRVTAREIVVPPKESCIISYREEAVNALMQMAREEIGHLLVVDENGSLVGLVTRSDIIRLIKVKTELGV